ncbi:DUF5372 family protein [Streptomyces cadmiisoli]|uniref:DUF5372 family protein n=1 Tax=Streptomyces cadmiisoli TaxID=2184053 RepID=UPI0013A6A1FC
MVTHPFHPLSGCELEILYVKRRSDALVFVCASGAGRSVTLPQAWTDRGVAAEEHPLAVEGPCAARALVNALASVFRFGSAELGERPCRRSWGCCWMVGMPQARRDGRVLLGPRVVGGQWRSCLSRGRSGQCDEAAERGGQLVAPGPGSGDP